MNKTQINKEFENTAKKLQLQAKKTKENFDVNYEAYKTTLKRGSTTLSMPCSPAMQEGPRPRTSERI